MKDLALLILRLVVGGLLAGHGAQKLFGSFGGSGLEGTSKWLESLGLRPGRQWALVAGGSEFLGGALTALGAMNPLGPVMAIGSMLMATVKVHAGKPIWVTSGGAELPVTNIAVMTALMIAGPGKISVDALFGTRVPRWLTIATLLGIAAVVSTHTMPEAPEAVEEEAGAQLQSQGAAGEPAGGQAEEGAAAISEDSEIAGSVAAFNPPEG